MLLRSFQHRYPQTLTLASLKFKGLHLGTYPRTLLFTGWWLKRSPGLCLLSRLLHFLGLQYLHLRSILLSVSLSYLSMTEDSHVYSRSTEVSLINQVFKVASQLQWPTFSAALSNSFTGVISVNLEADL